MSGNTKIQWTEKTWNPIVGCAKISLGCSNCYAEKEAARNVVRLTASAKTEKGLATRDAYAQSVHRNGKHWSGKVGLMPHRLTEPMSWRKPAMIFANSMSDLFHEDVPTSYIDQVFAVIALTPRHTYQVLTKRPQRMRSYLAGLEQEGVTERLSAAADEFGEDAGSWLSNFINGWSMPEQFKDDNPCDGTIRRWPLPNVWLGTSVEDQKTANIRLPYLADCPAVVRFLSCEPLLGHIRLTTGIYSQGSGKVGTSLDDIHWVIAGGESGQNARPCDVNWLRFMRDQCEIFGVPFFLKQVGAKPVSSGKPCNNYIMLKHPKGADPSEWPEDLKGCRVWPGRIAGDE